MTVKTDKLAGINLNLDTLDTEAAVEPFVFVAGGKRFVVEHIEDHDWQDLLNFDATDAEASMRLMLGDEQYDGFASIKGISMRKTKTLLTAIQEHFGMGDTPEGSASPGS